MALNNILNEPRREITETLVGLAAVGVPAAGFLWLDYHFALWLQETPGAMNGCPPPLGMIFGALILGTGVIILRPIINGIHTAGERVCEALDRRGVRLRPLRQSRP